MNVRAATTTLAHADSTAGAVDSGATRALMHKQMCCHCKPVDPACGGRRSCIAGLQT